MRNEGIPVAARASTGRTPFHNQASRVVRQKLRGRDVRKIAVLRANAIGDFIFTLPALEALKNRYPDAELVYLGKQWHRDFLAGRPGPVDRVVVVPRCKGVPHEADRVSDEQAVNAFFRQMQAEQFDIAIQMHGGGGNSNPFVARLGAHLTVGLCAEDAPPLDVNVPYYLYQPEILRYLEVASKLDANACTLQPRLALTSADRKALSELVPDLKCGYVVLHPGATDVRRQWSPENFASVGDALADAGYAVYVTGAGPEENLAGEVVAAMNRPATNLANKIDLRALTALLAQAELVITNDTGPLHLARAVATPTVGIYWMGNVITGGPPVATGNRCCIAWETHCRSCGKDCVHGDAHEPDDTCDHAVSFVDSVQPAEVLRHAESLLVPARQDQAAEMG